VGQFPGEPVTLRRITCAKPISRSLTPHLRNKASMRPRLLAWFPVIYGFYAVGVVCWWFFFGRVHTFHVAGIFITSGILAVVAITLPGLALVVLLFRT